MTLQHKDLEDLLSEVIEIDSDKSKMGDDADIVTVTFSTITQEAANDLSGFIERGYEFVLDADVTSSEQADGTYKVFVELERDRNSAKNIMELANGVQNLTGLENLQLHISIMISSFALLKNNGRFFSIFQCSISELSTLR